MGGRELEILQTEPQPNRITEHKIMNKKLKKGILPMPGVPFQKSMPPWGQPATAEF